MIFPVFFSPAFLKLPIFLSVLPLSYGPSQFLKPYFFPSLSSPTVTEMLQSGRFTFFLCLPSLVSHMWSLQSSVTHFAYQLSISIFKFWIKWDKTFTAYQISFKTLHKQWVLKTNPRSGCFNYLPFVANTPRAAVTTGQVSLRGQWCSWYGNLTSLQSSGPFVDSILCVLSVFIPKIKCC